MTKYYIVIRRPDGGWNTRQSGGNPDVAGAYSDEYPDCQVFMVEAPTRSQAISKVKQTDLGLKAEL